MADLYEIIKERFDRSDKKFDELNENTRETNQRFADPEHDARQLRLATEADVPTDKKTRKRAEDAAADQAKHGHSCSAKRIDTGSTSAINFGMESEPPALPRNEVLVDKGAEDPKPRLSPVETRMLIAAGG